ncbi:MAG: hypothetical protein ABL959_14880 [Pyrinomonadaceae bacterium]
MKRISLFVAIFVVVTVSALAQTPEEMAKARQAEQSAIKAYQAKNYVEFLAQMKLANAARPNHPRLIYNLASAYATAGESEPVYKSLARLANMGLFFDIAKDADFAMFVGSGRFKAIEAKFADNKKAVNNSTRAFSLDDKTLISEGLAYNAKTETFYVGSVHQRKIVAVKNGVAADFSSPADGLWSGLGMRVDIARGWLWVCTAAFPQMRGFDAKDKGKSGIFKYDLRTGKLAKKYILPDGNHALGDVLIGREGAIFATDSVSPVIYTIDPKRDQLEEFVRSDNFASLQGLAFSNGDREMFVADYSKGIFRIDMATKQIVQQTAGVNVTLLGIDGLYDYRGKLIAIQNGVTPHRVVSFSISGDRIDEFKTLEANHADFMEPTLGMLIGDDFYYVANSQWPLVNEKAELTRDKLRQPVVLRLDAKKALVK